MWDKEVKKTASTKKKNKEMQSNSICKIKKVGKDLVFNLGDGMVDKVILTTNYMELKADKEWGDLAKKWKSGGIYEGKDRVKIRNLQKTLTPQHKIATGPLSVKINVDDKNRDLAKVLRIVRDMEILKQQTETDGEFF